ncbi:extracellular solute-binding protein [Bacillus sp. P14.5]|uniref:ABC transporter substrate-binding protein n=1 Tax=Bacillus sp. P14.5 TaxID=1983400 RepID=UPI0013B060C1|nr:extracellular solute-binding protein [Bacillus sp. P14.5]
MSENNQRDLAAESHQVELAIRNSKVEIAEPFEAMVEEYEREHPAISITVETVGGRPDDFSDIKAKIAAGNGPDIFTNVGYGEAEKWSSHLEDLSGEPWVENARKNTLEPITINEKILGMPINLEGFGIVYNEELFTKAGILSPPASIEELEEAVKKLERAGITPFANGYYEEWKLGYHLPSLASTLPDEPKNSVPGTQTKRLDDLLTFIDFTMIHGNSNPSKTDYYNELDLFFTEKAAMVLQGNWIQPLLNQKAPHLSVGIMAVPITKQTDSKLAVGVPGYWVINKQISLEKKEAAKDFLHWMVSSETGQRYITEEFSFVPAFKNFDIQHKKDLTGATLKQLEEGEVSSSKWLSFPPLSKQKAGKALRGYTKENISREETLQVLEEIWSAGE